MSLRCTTNHLGSASVIITSFLRVIYPLKNPSTACLTCLYITEAGDELGTIPQKVWAVKHKIDTFSTSEVVGWILKKVIKPQSYKWNEVGGVVEIYNPSKGMGHYIL